MPVIEGLKQHGVALEDAVKILAEKGFNASY